MEENRFSEALLHEVFADLEQWNTFVNRYRSRMRLIWYKGNRARERDGDHIAHIALLAHFINERCKLGFDTGELLLRCLVHDAPEAYAKGGDTPAFAPPAGKYRVHKACTRESKPERERVAFERIEREWSERHPTFVDALRTYNAQDDDMSRFISALDKFAATFNIYQDNGRTNIRLRVTRAAEDAYKRHRIAAHGLVLKLYDLFSHKVSQRPNLYHQEAEESEATTSIAAE